MREFVSLTFTPVDSDITVEKRSDFWAERIGISHSEGDLLERKMQTYVFKIKTSTGGIVGNIRKQGTSQPDAERKLRQQYPNCIILDVGLG